MLARLADLCRRGHASLEGPQRCLLSVGHRGHQTQIIADGVPDGAGRAQGTQPRGACREWSGSLGQSNPCNRPLGESFNLARFEDARHE
jgi:hypothetical protein